MTLDRTEARDRLAGWYHTRRRRLPWRDEPTPYRVWVSEIMLQQTRVDTVIPYFERFVSAFPDVRALAEADEQDVLGLWAGLGYYRRCRNLHAAAHVMVERHGGQVPGTMEELLALPGVGRYTAGAIGSIAFGLVEPVLDGNVARVLARLMALEDEIDGGPGKRALWTEATAFVDPRDPGSHNQALMELGALVCTPTPPSCGTCPLEPPCAAAAAGRQHELPRKKPRRAPKQALAVAGLLRDDAGRFLLARRPASALLGGLWELPGGELGLRAPRRVGLKEALRERLALDATVGTHLASVTHVFTHRRLTLEVFDVPGWEDAPALHDWYTDLRWVDDEGPAGVPLSRLTVKVLDALGFGHRA